MLLPPPLSAQSLSFDDGVVKVYHQATDTEYVYEDGDGSSPENAPVFYIPIASNDNEVYQTTENLNASLITGSVARSTLSIPVNIQIADGGETWDAFIAAKKSSSEQYQVIYNRAGVVDGQSLDLLPDLDELCNEDDDLNLNCSSFRSGQGEQEDISLFLGVGVQGDVDHAGTTDSIDPKNYPDGIYILLKLSSEVTTAAPTVRKIYKGEKRLQVDFHGEAPVDVESLYARVEDIGSIANDEECDNKAKANPSSYQSLPEVGEDKKLETTSTNGQSYVKNLQNRRCYSIQIYYKDKYGFATGVSEGFNAAPESLEKLLDKNACFLLTAGFGGDDPIIDDFRHFRDHTLLPTSLGRSLINFYYKHAPTWAATIAASPLLSSWIRAMARAFHWLFL